MNGLTSSVESRRGQRYLVVSGDAHAGPSLERDLRPYCPERHVADFDQFARAVKEEALAELSAPDAAADDGTRPPLWHEAVARTQACAGQTDPHARLADMDAQGIAAEVIFAGGMNGEVLPWIGHRFWNGGMVATPPELRALGGHIWNQWLADYVSVAPERLVGVMQIPIWDVDAAIREVEWGAEHGLRAINLPSPIAARPSYNEAVYDPFWDAVEATGLPFCTHSAGGEPPLGAAGRAAAAIHLMETYWLSRRGLWQLILGGVFHQHPKLRLALAEQGMAWVPDTIREMDAVILSPNRSYFDAAPGLPSDYFASNCMIVRSFMAPYEAEKRHAVGLGNTMWGSDYPHVEGTWPRTALALRNTFSGVPEDELRIILGDNGVRFFQLDGPALLDIADRIGPTPAALGTPLTDEEFPPFRGLAFREYADFA